MGRSSNYSRVGIMVGVGTIAVVAGAVVVALVRPGSQSANHDPRVIQNRE